MDKTKNQASDVEEQKQKRQKSEHVLFLGAKRALVGSLLAGGIAFLGHLLVGRVYSGTEARSLLEAMVPSARSTGTAVVTASGTILALMLTMLSIGRDATSKLEAVFFQRVERIGLLSTIALKHLHKSSCEVLRAKSYNLARARGAASTISFAWLLMIVLVRLRYDGATRAYLDRKQRQGKTLRATLRCLKTHLARQLFRFMHDSISAHPQRWLAS